MSEKLSESAVVDAFAIAVANRVTRRVIAGLQRMHETLSGEGSALNTIWDEICVQVQYERSFSWRAYEETVRACVAGYVAELPRHEKEALWLQTEAGRDWRDEPEEDREDCPALDADYIAEQVYAAAGEWTNARIRAFIDRVSFRD